MPSKYNGYPVLSAKDSTVIEVWGPIPTESRWGSALWGTGVWDGVGWVDVTPQSLNAQITWGVDDNAGALSYPAAGSWNVQTYDPQRKLDPANTASAIAASLKPGSGVRIRYRKGATNEVVRIGFLDEIEYDIAAQQGKLRATDGVSLMVKAMLPAGLAHDTSVPMTLRARARWALGVAQVGFITVEADPAYPPGDPAIGLPIDSIASVWQQITTAAFDCLYGVWLDRNGVLKFRYYGTPHDELMYIGGDLYDSIAVDTVVTKLSMENVFNHFQATTDDLSGDVIQEYTNPDSIPIYGDLLFKRDRQNPMSWPWCVQLVQDRGRASVQYDIDTIRPQGEDHFLNLLNLGMVSKVIVRVDSHGTLVSQAVHVLGGRIEANVDTGWSVGLTTYQPAAAWYPQTFLRQYRFATNKSREIWRNTAGAVFGKSDSAQQEVRLSRLFATTDEMHYILMDFPAINWTGINNLVDAKLIFYRPMHDDSIQIIEKMWLKARRITAAWDETAVWPGPAATATGEGYRSTEPDLGEWLQLGIDDIVRAWAPATVIGGGAQPQYGIQLRPYWDTGGEQQEHLVISTKLSSMPAYLLLKVE